VASDGAGRALAAIYAGAFQGFVAADVPELAFWIAAREHATAVILVLDLDDDLRSCGFRAPVNFVRV
jgi:hypothetical protein